MAIRGKKSNKKKYLDLYADILKNKPDKFNIQNVGLFVLWYIDGMPEKIDPHLDIYINQILTFGNPHLISAIDKFKGYSNPGHYNVTLSIEQKKILLVKSIEQASLFLFMQGDGNDLYISLLKGTYVGSKRFSDFMDCLDIYYKANKL